MARATALSTAATVDDDFVTLIDRLDAITGAAHPNARAIAQAYSNLVYVRGYGEANIRVFGNLSLRCLHELSIREGRVLSALERSWVSGESEAAIRAVWTGWLATRIGDNSDLQSYENYRGRAREGLDRAEAAQINVLDSLKLRPNALSSGSVALFSAMSRIANATTREKLMRAWREARIEPMRNVINFLDESLSLRRCLARRRGFNSILEQTLSRGNVGEAEVETFLKRYAGATVESHRQLSSRVTAEFGETIEPLVHFPRFLANRAGGASVAAFDFEHCLKFIFGVYTKYLAIEWLIDWRGSIADIEIRRGDIRCGLISIDRIEGERAQCVFRREEPWARALRHTRIDPTGREVMSFDAVQIFFHECGHALSHVLAVQPWPSASGVDCSPAEKLELLSTWSEMWVFHDDFGAQLDIDTKLLAQCRTIRALEFERGRLERIATAILDFELHRSSEGGFQSVYNTTMRRYPDVFTFSLTELAHHFTMLSFSENGGGSFAYLWGGSIAAQWHRLESRGESHLQARMGDVPFSNTGQPEVMASFEFYCEHVQWGSS